MLKNSRVLGIIIPLVIVIVFLIINHSRTFTYDEFIRDHMDEGDEIEYVRITSNMYIQDKRFTIKIEDPDIIEKLTQVSYMELKRSFISTSPSPIDYPHEIRVQGKSSSFSFLFNESSIHKGKNFKLDDENDLFYIIKSLDLDWEMEK